MARRNTLKTEEKTVDVQSILDTLIPPTAGETNTVEVPVVSQEEIKEESNTVEEDTKEENLPVEDTNKVIESFEETFRELYNKLRKGNQEAPVKPKYGEYGEEREDEYFQAMVSYKNAEKEYHEGILKNSENALKGILNGILWDIIQESGIDGIYITKEKALTFSTKVNAVIVESNKDHANKGSSAKILIKRTDLEGKHMSDRGLMPSWIQDYLKNKQDSYKLEGKSKQEVVKYLIETYPGDFEVPA